MARRERGPVAAMTLRLRQTIKDRLLSLSIYEDKPQARILSDLVSREYNRVFGGEDAPAPPPPRQRPRVTLVRRRKEQGASPLEAYLNGRK